jgi:hypothetical protein
MKKSLIVALAVGTLISSALIVIEPFTDYAFLSFEWPGITAAYLFWGAVGSSPFLGVAIAWVVNALSYGLGAFVILSVLSALMKPKKPR